MGLAARHCLADGDACVAVSARRRHRVCSLAEEKRVRAADLRLRLSRSEIKLRDGEEHDSRTPDMPEPCRAT